MATINMSTDINSYPRSNWHWILSDYLTRTRLYESNTQRQGKLRNGEVHAYLPG